MLAGDGAIQNSEKLVSVIMPAYNGEKVIEASVESVLSQMHRPLELIIIDDASKDNTVTKVEKYKNEKHDAICRVIKHERNLGLAATLNHGIKESRGRYITILHQDCILTSKNWIEKALEYFAINEKTAVVTGYYGIPPRSLTFASKAFGVFRRQYHAINKELTDEEVTFSEGKCDTYRRDVLEMIGGFPERFRIAGEDLYVSYKIRQAGYSITKSYALPVVQDFGPAADSGYKNLKKEFVFGKAMGGIFPMFKTFLFKKINASKYSRRRSLQRATQPLFVFAFTLLVLLAVGFQSLLALYLLLATIGIRYLSYTVTVWNELIGMKNVFHESTFSSFLEALAIAVIGIVIDFAYTLGFGYGLILYAIGARL